MAAMKVAVRVRPSDKERAVYCDPHVGTNIKTDMNPQGLTFSTVLGQDSTQREAYLECGLPMLEAALDGQRACLFAYGQTGSGKTFSLLGAEGGKNPHKLDGIVPQIVSECASSRTRVQLHALAFLRTPRAASRLAASRLTAARNPAIRRLFRRFAQLESHGVKYNMWASFIEVHNEKARDLVFNGDPEYEQPILYVPSPAKEKVRTAHCAPAATPQANSHCRDYCRRYPVRPRPTSPVVPPSAVFERVTSRSPERAARPLAVLPITLNHT